MSVSLPDDIQGVSEANAELERLMAAEQQEQGAQRTERTREVPPEGGTPKDPSVNEAQRAGQQGENTQGKKDDTLAASEKTTDQADKTDPKDQKQPSKYQKARERQDKSWAEINAKKEELQREREEFDRQRKEHEARVKQAEEEFSPEAYEEAAKKFEDAGKYELADLAREKAAALRKNPPANRNNGQTDAATREWALKAGIDFPDLAKNNSPVQLRVAQLLREEPEFKNHPKGVYLAARLASLEQDLAAAKAGAASVSDKEKQITDLNKRIKELEEATAPGHGGAARQPTAKTFEQKSDEEQYAELERLAVETGPLR